MMQLRLEILARIASQLTTRTRLLDGRIQRCELVLCPPHSEHSRGRFWGVRPAGFARRDRAAGGLRRWSTVHCPGRRHRQTAAVHPLPCLRNRTAS